MDVYDQLDAAVYCCNLLQYGGALMEFAETALLDQNRAKLLNVFYERFTQFNVTDYVWDELHIPESYVISTGPGAMRRYIWLNAPQKGPPMETLKQLHAFGQLLSRSFQPPAGPLISVDTAGEILRYLDHRCGFSTKVFCDKKAVIGILPYSHSEFSSQCLARFNTGIGLHIFLYHTRQEPPHTIPPEFVLFHELAHALSIRRAGGISLHKDAAALLDRYFVGSLTHYSIEQQLELLADALAMGMMLDSPYEQFDPFVSVRREDKKVFRAAFEQAIAAL